MPKNERLDRKRGENAETVVADALLTTRRRLRPPNPVLWAGLSNLVAYVVTVAKRRLADLSESVAALPEQSANVLNSAGDLVQLVERAAGADTSVRSLAAAQEELRRFEELIRGIEDPDLRQLEYWFHIEGVKLEEIAARLGIAYQNARNLHRNCFLHEDPKG